jgi:hypothetical protein
MSKNQDRLVDYILEKEKNLTPAKIKALAEVIGALGPAIDEVPNQMKPKEDPNLIDETSPMDLTKVDKLIIDGNERSVNIFDKVTN